MSALATILNSMDQQMMVNVNIPSVNIDVNIDC